MKKQNLLFFLATVFCLVTNAQKPEQLLNTLSQKLPVEKVYLHFDRDNYIAGQTAWFKAYLYSDFLPDTISTSLYTEVINDKGVMIAHAIAPIILGTANSYFQLPDSLVTGSYIIRAYTATMLNRDADFIYKKSISIYGKNNKNAVAANSAVIKLEFFPEGGNIISGFSNTVAFKISDEYGLPLTKNGKIFTEKNTEVASFTSYHDGMGMFDFTPSANEKYYAVIDSNPTKYNVPEQTKNGIALTVMPHPQGNFFEIKQQKDNPAFQVAYMLGQMQHHIVFKQEFKAAKEEIQGIINTQNLHSGILQITFFNKDDQPLAERLCFVNNKEYQHTGDIIPDTINFSAKGKNRFFVRLKDTIQGSFSVSVTDADYDLPAQREENIFSNLLLTSDLKGYIHNPAYYFSADNDSIKTALDLVMMTNGWRRFKWAELSQKAAQVPSFKDGSFITVAGKIMLRDSKKPFAEKPLLLMLITADSTRKIQMITTDKLGNFRLDSMLFFGRSKVFFSDIRGKKNQYIDVTLSADSLTKSFSLPRYSQGMYRPPFFLTNNQSKLAYDFDAIQKANGIMMEGITIKTRKKSAIAELEEKYASGMFSGDANRTIDLVNDKDVNTNAYQNIFDYLSLTVPGLTVNKDGFDYSIFYRQQATISAMGAIPMTLYLDEIETDASFISTIPANQIAMVKVFSNFAGAAGNAPGGVLAVYTKKGADMNDIMQHAADMINYNGYTVTKEFYAPDYTVDKAAMSLADNRITLDWRPDILVNNINPKIPVTFYNSDRTKSFKIIVEGMTVDGKMLMIEKTISGTKGF